MSEKCWRKIDEKGYQQKKKEKTIMSPGKKNVKRKKREKNCLKNDKKDSHIFLQIFIPCNNFLWGYLLEMSAASEV